MALNERPTPMKQKRYTEEQIVYALKQAAATNAATMSSTRKPVPAVALMGAVFLAGEAGLAAFFFAVV